MNVVATQNVASIEANANPTGEAAADIGLMGFDDVLQQARRSKQPPAQAATQERKSREEARDNGDVEARATVGGPAIAIAAVAPMPPPAAAAAPFAQAPLAGAAQAGLRRAPPDKSAAAAIMVSHTLTQYLSPSYWFTLVFDLCYVLVQRVIVWLFKPVSASGVCASIAT